MRPIRASEIGSFLYCHRAWWYRLQGIESDHQAEMAAGTGFHQKHGGRVLGAGLLRSLGWILLLLAILTLAAWLTARVFP
ncbi:MAG TPA: hypothetical protein PLS77_04405 [Anaerolineaceae bacterium]|jgi:hypothetical protein|nr:hypothetical protein [Anaerolineaceae bacterium]NMD32065.1 hypothetical protein [Chloroflexota bacterium]HNS63592.1 hypothetical protein [Anaerolineaceae bacterium]HNZ00621.1 hypothetical protein [Anaerolineaceae bacterium]HOD43781.1 hypothetical protein [Anaerolineaceae bacterium]